MPIPAPAQLMSAAQLSSYGIKAANGTGGFLKSDVGNRLLTGFDFLEGAKMGRMF